MTQRKRIAVVTIGGTMFMTGESLKPGEIALPPLRQAISMQEAIARAERKGEVDISKLRELREIYGQPIDPKDIEIVHVPLFNVDSSKIRTWHLNKLGKKIAELSNDGSIDGIVVASGTDKMQD